MIKKYESYMYVHNKRSSLHKKQNWLVRKTRANPN